MSTVLAGCPERTGAPIDADSGFPDAAIELIDAGPPLPPVPRELAIEMFADGGVETIDGVTAIDPVTELAVRINVPLTDYRLRIFDESDKQLPSDDQASSADGGIEYRIVFPEPLRTGRKYTLLINAQTGTVLDDSAGRPYRDLEMKLLVRGEKQPEPKSAGAKKSKKRR